MGEEPGVGDHVQVGVGEGFDHLAGPLDGEEAVLFAPDELDGDVDLSVQPAEIMHELVVEAPQQPDGCVSMRVGPVLRLEPRRLPAR